MKGIQYYKRRIMEAVITGQRLDSVDVGSLAMPGHTVDHPLRAMAELIEDKYIRWEWSGINKYLVEVTE